VKGLQISPEKIPSVERDQFETRGYRLNIPYQMLAVFAK
jgi:hypothetical protein